MMLAGKKLTGEERFSLFPPEFLGSNPKEFPAHRGIHNENDVELAICTALELAHMSYSRQVPASPGHADIVFRACWGWQNTLLEIKYQPDRNAMLKAIGQCHDYRSRLGVTAAIIVAYYDHFHRDQFTRWQETALASNIQLVTYDMMLTAIYGRRTLALLTAVDALNQYFLPPEGLE